MYEIEDKAILTMFYGIGLLYGTRCSNENIIYDRHFVSNYYWHGNEENQKLHEVKEKIIYIVFILGTLVPFFIKRDNIVKLNFILFAFYIIIICIFGGKNA